MSRRGGFEKSFWLAKREVSFYFSVFGVVFGGSMGVSLFTGGVSKGNIQGVFQRCLVTFGVENPQIDSSRSR